MHRVACQSPVGPLAPNSKRITFEIINIFQFDDDGRFVHDFITYDNRSLLTQMRYRE